MRRLVEKYESFSSAAAALESTLDSGNRFPIVDSPRPTTTQRYVKKTCSETTRKINDVKPVGRSERSNHGIVEERGFGDGSRMLRPAKADSTRPRAQRSVEKTCRLKDGTIKPVRSDGFNHEIVEERRFEYGSMTLRSTKAVATVKVDRVIVREESVVTSTRRRRHPRKEIICCVCAKQNPEIGYGTEWSAQPLFKTATGKKSHLAPGNVKRLIERFENV